MKLLYKQHILNELDHIMVRGSFFEEYWNKELLAYTKALGCKAESPTDALCFLMSINDDSYCGYSEEIKEFENGDYYLYEKDDKTLYWFKTANDAMYFANNYNGSVFDLSLAGRPQDNYSFSSDFQNYHRKTHNGFLWLLKDDLNDLDDIASAPLAILCIEKQKYFYSEEEAVNWLVESGKAANSKTAMRQLLKCLNGETSRCYGFSWRKE